MATATYPKPKAAGHGRWIAAGVAAILVAILAALVVARPAGPAATTMGATATVVRDRIVASVAGTGTLAADNTLELAFSAGGTLAELLVAEGDVVAAGQALARLDTRDLESQVASAEASLESARARLEQQQRGNATPEQLASARASLTSAEANLDQTRSGNVTGADIAEAEAQLRSAQATLDDLTAGPKADELASAQASYDQAVANLESQRTSLSVAKEGARSELEQAANTLRTSQDDYSRIYWENRDLERLPGDLPQSKRDEEAAAARTVANNEQGLAQARLAYEQAQADELTGIASAEAQLREAEQKLRTTQAGATQAELIQAQASVDQARASLQKLRQGGTAAEIAAAQSSVDQARASLDELSAPATATDLRIEQASVAQAEQSLAQARLQLEQATLVAPFAGVVTSVDAVAGSVVSGASVVTLMDRDPLHVELRLSENDVARVSEGMPVTLRVDALRDTELRGTVSYIAAAAESESGVVTYLVRVDLADPGEAVKVGMTANLEIVYAEKADALLVPSAALQPDGAGYAVQLQGPDGMTVAQPVTVGLSDGTRSEILSGLSEGQTILAQPAQARQPQGGLFGQ